MVKFHLDLGAAHAPSWSRRKNPWCYQRAPLEEEIRAHKHLPRCSFGHGGGMQLIKRRPPSRRPARQAKPFGLSPGRSRLPLDQLKKQNSIGPQQDAGSPSVWAVRNLVQGRPGTRCIRKIGVVSKYQLQRTLSGFQMASGYKGHAEMVLVCGVIGNFLNGLL